MYAGGHLTNNERARETGVLATEAMLDVLPMQTRFAQLWAGCGPISRIIRFAPRVTHRRRPPKQQEHLISGV
jgi:hypothetical protein